MNLNQGNDAGSSDTVSTEVCHSYNNCVVKSKPNIQINVTITILKQSLNLKTDKNSHTRELTPGKWGIKELILHFPLFWSLNQLIIIVIFVVLKCKIIKIKYLVLKWFVFKYLNEEIMKNDSMT